MNKEIIFTDNAIKQINYLLDKKEKGSFFRIALKGGGCSGFQYDFSFDKVKNEDDLVFNNILIDKTSADMLQDQKWIFLKNLLVNNLRLTIRKASHLVVVACLFLFNVNFLMEC